MRAIIKLLAGFSLLLGVGLMAAGILVLSIDDLPAWPTCRCG